VAAVQGVVLVVAATAVLPLWLNAASVAVALGSLCWSFGRDIVWLSRQPDRTAPASAPVHAEQERRVAA
jgi:hypothetical protein